MSQSQNEFTKSTNVKTKSKSKQLLNNSEIHNTIKIHKFKYTGSVCLNGAHEISVPEILVVLAKLHLIHVLLRSCLVYTLSLSLSLSESKLQETKP